VGGQGLLHPRPNDAVTMMVHETGEDADLFAI